MNPDVDARTHPYISTGLKDNKFGIPHAHALAVYRRAASMANIRVAGIGCHIGSQILETSPLDEALEAAGIPAGPINDYAEALARLSAGLAVRMPMQAPLVALLALCGVLTMLSFGFWVRPWIKVRYPDFPAVEIDQLPD